MNPENESSHPAERAGQHSSARARGLQDRVVRRAGGLIAGWPFGVQRAIERATAELGAASELRLATAAQALVELGQRRGGLRAWEAIAEHLGRMNPALRERVLLAGGEVEGAWEGAAERLAASGVGAQRKCAAALAGWTEKPLVVMCLIGLVSDAERGVQDAAVASLVGQVKRCVTGVGVEDQLRGAIEKCVRGVLDEFDRHRRGEVIWCAFELLGTPARRRRAAPELRAWLELEDHVAHRPARGALRKPGPASEFQATVGHAMQMMSAESLGGASGERVLQCQTRREFEQALWASHLFSHSGRAKRFAKACEVDHKASAQFVSDERLVSPDGAREAAQVMRVLAATERPEGANAAIGLLADERASVRHALARASIAGEVPIDVLLDTASDVDSHVAMTSLAGIVCPGVADRVGRAQAASLCRALSRSAHGRVRRLAGEFGAGLDAFDPRSARSRVTARRLHRRNREGMEIRLRERLLTGTIDERVAAAHMMGVLGVVEACEGELLAMVRSALPGDHGSWARGTHEPGELRVCATCVSALGRSRSAASFDALLAGALSPDDRVRSNALDALLRRVTRTSVPVERASAAYNRFVELREHGHHRVRASALLGDLMTMNVQRAGGRKGQSAATGALVGMLADPRPMHRVAALWAAERASERVRRVRGEGFEGAVASMISGDVSDEVRRRARLIAARMMARSAAATAV